MPVLQQSLGKQQYHEGKQPFAPTKDAQYQKFRIKIENNPSQQISTP
jgi:hypothetical protein